MTLALVSTTIKITVIVLVALSASALLRRRSAAVRHFVLAAALACAAATPAVQLVVPAWQATAAWLPISRMEIIDRPLAVLDSSTSSTPSTGGHEAAAPSWGAALARVLTLIWMTGVAAALLVIAVGLGRLRWLASRAQRVATGPWADIAVDISRAFRLRRPPELLQSEHATLLVTWGVWRPKVLIPAGAGQWPADRIRIVLAHELAHVRRGDWLVQMASQILRVAYWFNPLVWLACRRLRLESERACDDAVLRLGVDGTAYAAELVTLARSLRSARHAFVPAAAIARPSNLERRVRAMLNTKLNRDPLTRSTSIAAAFVFAVVTVVIAGFGASAQSPFGSVSGLVTDQNGRSIAGVTLVLSNASAQVKYGVKSDAAGRYEFVGVTPATYELLFEYAGMATIKREGLGVAAGQAATVDAVMRIGSLQETITVTDTPNGPRSAPVPRRSPSGGAYQRPDPCAGSTNGGCIRQPAKVKDVRPVYPIGARSGNVELMAMIGADGRIASVDVVGDGGGRDADPALADSAASAVRQWEFLPTHLGGQPVETRMKVTVHFTAAK